MIYVKQVQLEKNVAASNGIKPGDLSRISLHK